MAIAEFIHDGKSVDYTPSAAVTAGTVVVQEELLGVCLRSIEAGEQGALAVEGVFSFPHDAVEKAVGKDVYWDADGTGVGDETGCATLTDTGVYLGKAVQKAESAAGAAAALATDTTVRVKLIQDAPTASGS